MSATTELTNSDLAILNRMIKPDRNDLPATAARAILKIDFEESDRERMRVLSQKARAGNLTIREQEEIDDYERVSHFLGLLHSKARKSLKKRANGRAAHG